MAYTDEQRAENDRRIANDIREHGCHVISVFDPEEKLPTFSYSIGIQETTGAPEAIVVGLQPKLGHSLINHYLRECRAGKRFGRGTAFPGFLEGFDIYFEPARRKLLTGYTLGCDRYYGHTRYAVVQMVWPSTSGVWPWEKAASDWLRCNQPMLGRKRPDRP